MCRANAPLLAHIHACTPHTSCTTYTLQHTATHCNTLQHTATHMHPTHILHDIQTPTHCNTLQHTAAHCNTRAPHTHLARHTDTNTLQHTATHCNTLQHACTPHTSCTTYRHQHKNTHIYVYALAHAQAHSLTRTHINKKGMDVAGRASTYSPSVLLVIVCCSVLQRVAVCCSVISQRARFDIWPFCTSCNQCVATCCCMS